MREDRSGRGDRGPRPEAFDAGDSRPVGLGRGCSRPRAEVRAARAAEAAGFRSPESTVSICSIEEVAEATSVPPLVPLYVMQDRGYAEEKLMARAEAVGAPVLAPTIDLAWSAPATATPATGWVTRRPGRPAEARTRPRFPSGLGQARADRRQAADLRQPGRSCAWRPHPGGLQRNGSTPSSTLRSPGMTSPGCGRTLEGQAGGQGVLDPEDARKAVDAGVDGVVVSNHGGRQFDAVPSTAAAPARGCRSGQGRGPRCRRRRNGLDMVKMLALGAEAVIIGRAWAWAVAAEGQTGVEKMLRVLEVRRRRRPSRADRSELGRRWVRTAAGLSGVQFPVMNQAASMTTGRGLPAGPPDREGPGGARETDPDRKTPLTVEADAREVAGLRRAAGQCKPALLPDPGQFPFDQVGIRKRLAGRTLTAPLWLSSGFDLLPPTTSR